MHEYLEMDFGEILDHALSRQTSLNAPWFNARTFGDIVDAYYSMRSKISSWEEKVKGWNFA